MEVINNTVFIDGSTGGPCLSVSSLQAGYTQVVANNAFIRGDTSTARRQHEFDPCRRHQQTSSAAAGGSPA